MKPATAPWVVFWISQMVVQDSHANWCQDHHLRKDTSCYEFVTSELSFSDAQTWCAERGGNLAPLWRLEKQKFLKKHLREDVKWWIRFRYTKKRRSLHRNKRDHGTSHSPDSFNEQCSHIIMRSSSIQHDLDTCSNKHFFICRFEPEKQTSTHIPGASAEPDSADLDSSSEEEPEPTTVPAVVEGTEPEKQTSVPTRGASAEPNNADSDSASEKEYLSTTIPALVEGTVSQKTIRHIRGDVSRDSPAPSERGTCAYLRHRQTAPTKPPKETKQPITLPTIGPSGVLQTGTQSTEELIATLKDVAVQGNSFTMVVQASVILLAVLNSTKNLSLQAQVNASYTLLYLTQNLLQELALNRSLLDQAAPAATVLFNSFDNIMQRMKISSANWNPTEVDDLLYSSLEALNNIETAFLRHTGNEGLTLNVSSTVCSTIVSRKRTPGSLLRDLQWIARKRENASTVHLSPFRTPLPASCQVSFPRSATLENLLSKYSEIQVRVAALTFNPFKYISKKDIVGSVANIALSHADEDFNITDIPEPIEIILYRNDNTTASPQRYSVRRDQLLQMAVNVTSKDDSLVVRIKPELSLPVMLFLGYQYSPNDSHFDLNATFPDNDGGYTWVLSPAQLKNGTGFYNITAYLNSSITLGANDYVNYSVTSFTTQCLYWNQNLTNWELDGCHVGPKSTAISTQCLCHHLTFFGSTFLVMPRLVDIRDSAKLFANAANNPVALILLGSLLGFYILTAIWSYIKDKQDRSKVKVTVLADNAASAHYRYLVKVFTGHRRHAATTAKVVLTIYGAEGQSDPHHLTDPGKAVFERGGVDIFLLKTHFLGELHSIRLWHDNSGSSPAWYVTRVTVVDLEAQKKWHFLCDSWLAIDIDDCQLDRIFPAASMGDIMSFRYLMFSNSVERLIKNHLWLSVITRCPWSPFTRVQRLSCSMTLLLCSMLINLMFWNRSSDSTVEGELKVTVTQLIISMQTTIILVPANFIIVYMFLLIQVHLKDFKHSPAKISVTICPEPLPEASTLVRLHQCIQDLRETVHFLHLYVMQVLGLPMEGIGNSKSELELMETLSRLIHSHVSSYCEPAAQKQTRGLGLKVVSARHHHFLCYLHRVLQKMQFELQNLNLNHHVQSPNNILHVNSELQKLMVALEGKTLLHDLPSTSLMTGFPATDYTGSRSLSSRLPGWFPYICWFVLFCISGISAYYLALLSLSLTKEKTTSWVISMLMSLFQSIFIVPPAKTVAVTIFQLRVLKKENMEDTGEEQQLQAVLAVLGKHPDWELSGWRDPDNPIYQPPSIIKAMDRKKLAHQEAVLYRFIRDFIVHNIFLVSMMILAYAEKSPNEFYLNSALQKSFTSNIQMATDVGKFYKWASDTLLPNLYGPYEGFITDGNCYLLGSPRIRQLRVVPDPHTVFHAFDNEDYTDYGPGWARIPQNSTNKTTIWDYQSEEELEGYPIWATFAVYSGGGYVAELGANQSSTARILENLQNCHWLDNYTKAIFLEFSVYNANANLFCVITLIFETNGIGSFFNSADLQAMQLYDSTENTLVLTTFAQISFLLLMLYSVILQGFRLKEQKWKYFLKKMNQLDLCIIVIGCCVVALYLKRIALRKRDIARSHRNRARFVSFYETGTVDSALGYNIAFLVSLATVKLWNLLNINPSLHLITSTLYKAWNEIKGFLLMVFVLLVAYSISCNLLFGWSIYSYRTFFSTAVTIVSLMIGIFNYDEVISLDPILGALLVTTCVVLLMFVIINLLLSAMLMVFSKERQSSELYKQEETVELLLQKLSSLLGIRRKAKTCALTAAHKKGAEN